MRCVKYEMIFNIVAISNCAGINRYSFGMTNKIRKYNEEVKKNVVNAGKIPSLW